MLGDAAGSLQAEGDHKRVLLELGAGDTTRTATVLEAIAYQPDQFAIGHRGAPKVLRAGESFFTYGDSTLQVVALGVEQADLGLVLPVRYIRLPQTEDDAVQPRSRSSVGNLCRRRKHGVIGRLGVLIGHI